MDTLRHHAPYKYSEFCWGHHGSAGVVVGNTIQVRLGALTIPLVAFWLKRVLGSRDCPQVGKVPCSFFNRPPTLLVGLYSLGESYGCQWHFGLRSKDNMRPWGCRIVDCKSRPSHPSRSSPGRAFSQCDPLAHSGDERDYPLYG